MSGIFASWRRTWRTLREERRREALRRRFAGAPAGALVHWRGLRLRIADPWDAYIMAKDIWLHGIYRAKITGPRPYVIDAGSHVGFAAVASREAYPTAEVLAIEPDPGLHAALCENVAANCPGVRCLRAAVGATAGRARLELAGSSGGRLAASGGGPEVEVIALPDLLDRPVDLLKLNIEGAEQDALPACGERLRQVSHLVCEYHHFPGTPRNLPRLLDLLTAQGFTWSLHDFDRETQPETKPPAAPPGRWCLLIRAQRHA